MTGRIPSRGSEQFNLRLPDGMRDRLREAAEANGRSMNAEIIARLGLSFENEENMKRLSARIEKDELIISYEMARREMASTQKSLSDTVSKLEEITNRMRRLGINVD